jgi:DNA gyrase subunit B
VPVDIEPRTGLTGLELVFTKLHAGGKFGAGSYAASGGLHGVGASVVNALAERLDVEVDRDGKTWAMSFHRGEPGVFMTDPRALTELPRLNLSLTAANCGFREGVPKASRELA